MNNSRIKKIIQDKDLTGPVVYWMNRELRFRNNWSLIYAINRAQELEKQLIIFFIIDKNYNSISSRQEVFINPYLSELKVIMERYTLPFIILKGEFLQEINSINEILKPSELITDLNPLTTFKNVYRRIIESGKVNFTIIDSHNIVPVWITSKRKEYAAYTIRPKINSLLTEFIEPYPEILNNLNFEGKIPEVLVANEFKTEISELKNLYNRVENELEDFINNKLNYYALCKNDPNMKATSNISHYLHFGILNAQDIVLRLKDYKGDVESKKIFLEELIIRKELSDNYTYYENDYDLITNIPDWARKTLDEHRKDKRDFTYGEKKFENADTHDQLWNAAQKELINTGKIHGYMRMYWAKKILEWTLSPEEAVNIAVYLNDKYALDGNDPNGYVGIMWSICGVHDRPWFERKVFGKVRYMNASGCRKKFNTEKYINQNL